MKEGKAMSTAYDRRGLPLPGTIMITQEETIVRQRTYTHEEILNLLTDELDHPQDTREELEKLSDSELASKVQDRLDERDEVYDCVSNGYYEPYEVDGRVDYTVEPAHVWTPGVRGMHDE